MLARLILIGLFSTLCLGASERVFAQSNTQPATKGDEALKSIVQLALSRIHSARCADNKICEHASADELQNPPITISEARTVVTRGTISGFAELCNGDWRKENFVPMMTYWRRTQKKTERQMALIAIIHGVAQDVAKERKTCTDQMKRLVETRIAFQP
jgi:hypothetical protein